MTGDAFTTHHHSNASHASDPLNAHLQTINNELARQDCEAAACWGRTKLMGQDSDDLVLLALLDEGVVEDDALVLEEAIHVGVAVRAARGPVHHK